MPRSPWDNRRMVLLTKSCSPMTNQASCSLKSRWEPSRFLRLVTSSRVDMGRRVLVVWLTGKKTCHSLVKVLPQIWLLIHTPFHPEWQLGTWSSVSSPKSRLWTAVLVMPLLSVASKSPTLRLSYMPSAIRNMETSVCTMVSLVRCWMCSYSLDQLTTRDLSTWLVKRCTQEVEALFRFWLDSPLRVEVEMVVSGSEKWSETAWFRTDLLDSWRKD